MERLPPYTEAELAGFEAANGVTLPSEFRRHLLTTRVVTRCPGAESPNSYYLVDLYAGDPQTTDIYSLGGFSSSGGSGVYRAWLQIDHPFLERAEAISVCHARQVPEPHYIAIRQREFDYLSALEAIERLAKQPVPFKIVEPDDDGRLIIAEHGCGQRDEIDLATGRVYYRDCYRNARYWHSGVSESFDAYMKQTMGGDGPDESDEE